MAITLQGKDKGQHRRLFILCLVGFNLLLFAGIFAVFLYVTDRFIERRRPLTLVYRAHPFRRMALLPNQTYENGDVSFLINEAGFRGPFPRSKAAGTIRIFAVGGSSVFDHRVSKSWPERLCPLLEAQGLSLVECFNAGIPGYSSRETLALYRDSLRFLKPDVVVFYQGWNDVKYMKPFADEIDIEGFFTIKDFSERYRFLTAPRPLRNWYALWEMVWLRSGKTPPLGEQPGPNDAGKASKRTPARDRLQLSRTGGPQKKRRLEQSKGLYFWRANLEELVREVLADGALPVLVAQNTLADRGLDPSTRKRIAYRFVGLTHEELLKINELMVQILNNVAEEFQIPHVDLRSRVNGKIQYFGDHVHMTPVGSYVFAWLLARELADILEEHGYERRKTAPLESSPTIAHWSFDDQSHPVKDRGPFGLVGRPRGAVRHSSSDCRVASCYAFDGKTGAIIVPPSNYLHLQAGFQIEAWVKPAGSLRNSHQGLIVKGGAYHFELRNGRPAFYGYGLNPQIWHVAEKVVSSDEWHLLKIQHRDGRLRIFLDSETVYDASVEGSVQKSSRPLQIGAASDHFYGKMDEVRLSIAD